MTMIGTSYLLSAVRQLRTDRGIAEVDSSTAVAKTLAAATNTVELSASNTLLVRQQLNAAADVFTEIEMTSVALDRVAGFIVDMEANEIEKTRFATGTAEYAALEIAGTQLQRDLTDYVSNNIVRLTGFSVAGRSDADLAAGVVSDQSYFDLDTWGKGGVAGALEAKVATLGLMAQDLTIKLHDPSSCPICTSGEPMNAAPTTNSATNVGSTSDTSTTVTDWDALRSGSLWNVAIGGTQAGGALSYSYYNGAAPYSDPYNGNQAGGPQSGTITALNSTQQTDHDVVMAAWDAVIAPDFDKVTEANASTVGEIRIAYTSAGPSGSAAYAYYPSNSNVGGDTWYMSTVSSNDSFAAGTYGMLTALHEIGHAIGLKHPFQSSGSAGTLASSDDNARNTVMTYTQDDRNYMWNITVNGNSVSASIVKAQPITPMLYDVAFAQENYGIETSVRSTDTMYTFASAPEVLQTIVDGGGNDTIDASALSRTSIINLTAGAFSSIGYYTAADQATAAIAANPNFSSFVNGLYVNYSSSGQLYEWNDNVAIAYSATIENALGGSGADTITGNSAANELWGNSGDDTIDGGAGVDTVGFTGNYAQYTIDTGARTVTDTTLNRDGTDTYSNVEFLKFADLTYNVSTGATTATVSAAAPSGDSQSAASVSAAAAAAAAAAVTSTKNAAATAAASSSGNTVVSRTVKQAKSVRGGRIAALRTVARSISGMSSRLKKSSVQSFHGMASASGGVQKASSPHMAKSAKVSSPSRAAASAAMRSTAASSSAQATRPPMINLENRAQFSQAFSVNRAQIMAIVAR